MNLLLIGSGGREHAIACKLLQSPLLKHLYVVPGNGGFEGIEKVTRVSIAQNDFDQLLLFAQQKEIDLVVVGPEQPLVEGIADKFKKIGIPVFGPSQRAAQLEGSKAFAKDFMREFNIPTADYQTFTDFDKAKAYIESNRNRLVLKASGLAAGKGVLLPETREEALDALHKILVQKAFGEAGSSVVIEEYLEGEEVSILAFTDGYTVLPLPAAQDHKRIFDGDKGENTGGMGAYAPAPLATPEFMAQVKNEILLPTVKGMRQLGSPFVGILYAGLMVTSSGPKVLEFNCRFGDPETQVLMPLLSEETDLLKIMLACTDGYLDTVKLSFKKGFAAAVVLASEGYPGSYPKNLPISMPKSDTDLFIYHAGTEFQKSQLVTSGGRVLAVSCVSDTLQTALNRIYDFSPSIQVKGVQYRKDIGHRALKHFSKKEISYADAGVSIDNGNLLVEKIKSVVRATKRPGTDAEIGGFGGLFDLTKAGFPSDCLLVSSTDGVGTKLKLAHIMQKHDTIGIDLVAMNVNDLIVQGAEPLFFLDYFACGRLNVDIAKEVVSGVAEGCLQANCALIGGETAEMPGFYQGDDYDLAGFTVGAVKRELFLPKTNIQSGDVVIGLPSSGVHSNGYSLVRHLIKVNGFDYHQQCPFETSRTLGEVLLEPTRIYIRALMPLVKMSLIKAMAHITGGGFIDNIPRVLPDHLGTVIDASQYPQLPVFKWLKKIGQISAFEMSRTFNCGIGMILLVDKKDVETVMSEFKQAGEQAYVIGKVFDRKETGEHSVLVKNTESWDSA